MSSKQKSNVLVKNASFLMAAALISKIVGLLYKSPLTHIVGADGMAYYGLAQQAYMILLMIASYSIPQAVSKIIAEKLAKESTEMLRNILRVPCSMRWWWEGQRLFSVWPGQGFSSPAISRELRWR